MLIRLAFLSLVLAGCEAQVKYESKPITAEQNKQWVANIAHKDYDYRTKVSDTTANMAVSLVNISEELTKIRQLLEKGQSGNKH